MSGEYREGPERDIDIFPFVEGGEMSMGVDPGATYTGVVVVEGEVPVFAETITRDKGEGYVEYALRVAHTTHTTYTTYNPKHLGIELLTMPKGFNRASNKTSPINPGHLVMAGIVLGATMQQLNKHNPTLIHPRGNGSRRKSWYHPSLLGRRPPTLAGSSNGAGRGHEQSAYDVALKASGII